MPSALLRSEPDRAPEPRPSKFTIRAGCRARARLLVHGHVLLRVFELLRLRLELLLDRLREHLEGVLLLRLLLLRLALRLLRLRLQVRERVEDPARVPPRTQQAIRSSFLLLFLYSFSTHPSRQYRHR